MKSDVQIKQDVLDELDWDAEIDESKIGVTVTHGALTLSGHVPTYPQRLAALRAIKRVAGVLSIVNNVEVTREQEHRLTDEGLAERIANVLKWNVSIPGESIKADVKNGIVTLSGEVDWHYQRANILKNVEHIGGVASVINLIALKPRVSVGNVQRKITDALQRHATVEAGKIDVRVSKDTVTLSGTVESIEEMDRVEDATWAAPGVSAVIENLRVMH